MAGAPYAVNGQAVSPIAPEVVCAVVVTFHPRPEVVRNLALVAAQLKGLIVVDNGSEPAELEMLREASRDLRFLLLENGSNPGIASALNRGTRQAEAQGYQWVALFDQDSSVTDGFFKAMFKAVEQHPRRDRVAVFCPRYIDKQSGLEMPRSLTSRGRLAVVRTSGSLMPLRVFRECGWFMEELVIDQVDYEYCLRVRSRGFEIAECPGATLLHTLGAPTMHRLFGVRLFGTTNHSAARRYYLVRNRTWLLKRYWSEHTQWCGGALLATLKECVRIAFVEDGRREKLRNTLLGIRDGVRGRMGKTVKL